MIAGGVAASPVAKELTVASTGKVVASTGTSDRGRDTGNRRMPAVVTGNQPRPVASSRLPRLRIASKIATTGKLKSLASTGWRIEVTGGGKYWQWRRGSGKSRQSRYGGKFRELSPERQAAYRQNVERRRRAPDHPGEP